MSDIVLKSRLGGKSQMIMPKQVRDVLGLKPGDPVAFVIRDGEVRLVATPVGADDPWACFTEWGSDADSKGYADL